MSRITKKQITGDAVRKRCLDFMFVILTCNAVFGEIKNGYEKDILSMKESLKSLSAILLEKTDLPSFKRRKIESSIDALVNHISYYELTENLLTRFRIITPGLYAEIDTISDRIGRPVNVYVRFIPMDATEVKALGTTYVSQTENDKNACRSEYGAFSVSVKIWIVPNALLVLSHELGHVKYLIPNLASYADFYKDHYNGHINKPNNVGHYPGDPSGKSSIEYEKLFRKDYAGFLKTANRKIQNPIALLATIRKNFDSQQLTLINKQSSGGIAR
jgi:hypothetical protein